MYVYIAYDMCCWSLIIHPFNYPPAYATAYFFNFSLFHCVYPLHPIQLVTLRTPSQSANDFVPDPPLTISLFYWFSAWHPLHSTLIGSTPCPSLSIHSTSLHAPLLAILINGYYPLPSDVSLNSVFFESFANRFTIGFRLVTLQWLEL